MEDSLGRFDAMGFTMQNDASHGPQLEHAESNPQSEIDAEVQAPIQARLWTRL